MSTVATGTIGGEWRGLDLLTPGAQEMIEAYPPLGDTSRGMLFVPQFCYAVLRSKVGAVTTTARIRIGGNGAHDNVIPLYTIPAGAGVDAFAMPPLVASPYTPWNLRAGPILVEVERAAIGPTTYTGDIMIAGILVSG
jgi:hypothetical protein